jgi:hypothetical protein
VYDSTGACGDVDRLLTYAKPGTWTISYELTGFSGRIDVAAFAFERA